VTLTWGNNNGALAGRGKECWDLFCLGASCLDAPIHEELVIRDAKGICFDDDSTSRLEGFIIRDFKGIYFEDDSTTRFGGQRGLESKA